MSFLASEDIKQNVAAGRVHLSGVGQKLTGQKLTGQKLTDNVGGGGRRRQKLTDKV